MTSPLRPIPDAARGPFETGERCTIEELLNSPVVPEASLARATVAPGVTTQLHALAVRELYVVLSGRGTMDAGDGMAVPVGPGSVVDIPAGTAQRIRNDGEDALVFLCLCLPRFTEAAYEALGA